jgi:hypothetical protein
MVKQAFWPIEHDITKIVEFCERKEIAESVFNTVKAANSHAQNNGSKSSFKQKPSNKGGSWKGQDNALRSTKHKHYGKCASYTNSNVHDDVI